MPYYPSLSTGSAPASPQYSPGGQCMAHTHCWVLGDCVCVCVCVRMCVCRLWQGLSYRVTSAWAERCKSLNVIDIAFNC